MNHFRDMRDAAEKAYGILWRDCDSSEKGCAARKLLLDVIGKDGQHRGIDYALTVYGPATDEEMMHVEWPPDDISSEGGQNAALPPKADNGQQAPACAYCGHTIGLRMVHDGGGFTAPEYACEACFVATDTGPCFDDLREVS